MRWEIIRVYQIRNF